MSSSASKQTFFKPSWLNEYSWITQVENDPTKFGCDWCSTVGKLGNMGVKAVRSHENGMLFCLQLVFVPQFYYFIISLFWYVLQVKGIKKRSHLHLVQEQLRLNFLDLWLTHLHSQVFYPALILVWRKSLLHLSSLCLF